MSKQSGTAVIITADGNPIAASRSASFSGSVNMIDLSSKSDNGWQIKKPGKKSATLSLDGVVDFADTAGQNAVADAIIAGSVIAFVWGPETPATGDMTLSGNMRTESVEFSAPDDEAAGMSMSFQVTGAVTKNIT